MKSSNENIWNICRKDPTFLIVLLLVSLFLIFHNLGNLYFILDEYDYAVLGKNTLKYGFPTMWDGKNFVAPESHSIYYLWGQQAWLSFYLIAISYFFFGFTSLATRIPFAISGLISIFILYALTLRITWSRKTARVASLLFVLSVPSLIYMRTGRYMALTFLLSILCIWFYLDLIESKKGSFWKFTATLIAYFHTFFPQMVGLAIGIIVHLFLTERGNKKLTKDIFKSFIITFLFTFPWFALIGYPVRLKMIKLLSEMIGNPDYSTYPGLSFMMKNVFAFLAQINTYIFPFLVIIIAFITHLFSKKLFRLGINQKYILLLVLIFIFSVLLMSTSPIPMQNYISGTIPILFLLLSVCFRYLYSCNSVLASTLLMLVLFSNILHVSIWYPVGFALNLSKSTTDIQNNSYFRQVESQVRRSKKIESLVFNYLGENLTDFNGPQRAIVNHLLDHGNSDQTVLIAHEGNAIAFYTNMKLVDDISLLNFPDWIIPRGRYKLKVRSFYPTKKPGWIKQEEHVRSLIRNKNLYRKIVLPVNDRGTENSYEIQVHHFSNYDCKGCQQVTLYKFVGEKSEMNLKNNLKKKLERKRE